MAVAAFGTPSLDQRGGNLAPEALSPSSRGRAKEERPPLRRHVVGMMKSGGLRHCACPHRTLHRPRRDREKKDRHLNLLPAG